jgi:hypothetical protein
MRESALKSSVARCDLGSIASERCFCGLVMVFPVLIWLPSFTVLGFDSQCDTAVPLPLNTNSSRVG